MFFALLDEQAHQLACKPLRRRVQVDENIANLDSQRRGAEEKHGKETVRASRRRWSFATRAPRAAVALLARTYGVGERVEDGP